MRRFISACSLLVVLLLTIFLESAPSQAASPSAASVSYWGMNAYITKRERLQTGDTLGLLADMGRNAGVQWTREELPWALIEQTPGNYQGVYDSSLNLAAGKGYKIIGMLLTTPTWARDHSCVNYSTNFWCPPADVNAYARWVSWMVHRYNGSTPGLPRIDAWEIWNEPNDTAQWPDIAPDANARKLRYGNMLVAAFNAVRAADPTALVLTGGTYIYDGGCYSVCDGLNFFNAGGGVFQQVPAAKGAFDIFSIHPYMSTDRPDAPQIPPRITVEGRIQTTRTWLNRDIGRPDAPIWVTEIGWCTTGGACPAGVAVSEDSQASFLIRSMVIAQQNNVQHTSWFQLEDAFNAPSREWSYAAIIHDYDPNSGTYPVKPAYNAYRTLALTIGDGTPNGYGPVNTHVYNGALDSGNTNPPDTYDYRYNRGATTIDVLWVPSGAKTVSFPIDTSRVITLIDRDGAQSAVTPSNGAITLNLSERPIFITQSAQPRLVVSPNQLAFVALPGSGQQCVGVSITNAGAGTLTWTASTATPWLSVAPAAGSAPATLTVCAMPGSVTGVSSGAVHIDAGAGGSTDIPVWLSVTNRIVKLYLPQVRRN